jgi:hypothetical protein
MGSDTDTGYDAMHDSGPIVDRPASGFKEALLAIPDVGEDSDFARHDDGPREVDMFLEE